MLFMYRSRNYCAKVSGQPGKLKDCQNIGIRKNFREQKFIKIIFDCYNIGPITGREFHT